MAQLLAHLNLFKINGLAHFAKTLLVLFGAVFIPVCGSFQAHLKIERFDFDEGCPLTRRCRVKPTLGGDALAHNCRAFFWGLGA